MMLRPAEDVALFTAEMAAWPGVGPLKRLGGRARALGRGQRRLPARHPRQALRRGAAAGQRAARPDAGPVALQRLERRPQRPDAAGGDGRARRGRDGRPRGAGPAVGPRRAGLPRPATRAAGRRAADPAGAPAARARHRPGEGDRRCPASPATSATPARRPSSRGSAGRGGSTRPTSTRPFVGRTALLSPLDRLVIDRKRMGELFDFDYQLEMYKPAAKRRFGYWAMPVLVGDRLVGKLDATAERDRGRAPRRRAPRGRAVGRVGTRRRVGRGRGAGRLPRPGGGGRTGLTCPR